MKLLGYHKVRLGKRNPLINRAVFIEKTECEFESFYYTFENAL